MVARSIRTGAAQGMAMSYYLSMQMVRFRSESDYERFRMLFKDVQHHLRKLSGFVHLTWWQHPDDPSWFNEISIWADKKATLEWHDNGYHKWLKKWGLSGPIIEDIVTNWTLEESKIMRLCPACNTGVREPFEMRAEVSARQTACKECGFRFPFLETTDTSFAVFRDGGE